MNICGISSIYFVACLLLFIVHTISGEYSIGKTIPSYMFRKYDNVEEEIFPQDIRIKLILSKVSGTLLYSIDKHMNQMIVSLYDRENASIDIEFRKTKNHIYLSKLCGCEDCRYEILEFFIQIKDTINLQCNNGSVQKYDYNTEKELNSEYPLPYSNKQVNPPSHNEAHLWLVNHQSYKDLYPNPKQMVGCIFEVKYKNIPVKFTTISDKIEQQCKRRCVVNICNGGTCHETFNGRPVCNCTETFLNGPNCTDTITQINRKAYGLSFQITLLKVSWKSMSKEIFALSNTDVKIGLTTFGDILHFEIKNLKNSKINPFGLTLRGYVRNKESIFLANFSDKNIQIKIFNNDTWHFGSISSTINLGRKTFTNLTLRSESGTINLAYKPFVKNHKWRNVEIINFEEIKTDFSHIIRNISGNITAYNILTIPSMNVINKDEHRNSSLHGSLFVLIGLVSIIVVGMAVILIVLYFKVSKIKAVSYFRASSEGQPFVNGNKHHWFRSSDGPESLKAILENFMRSIKGEDEREDFVPQCKELEILCKKCETKDDIISNLPEFMMLGSAIQKKAELCKVLKDYFNQRKFPLTKKQQRTVDGYLQNLEDEV